MAKSLILNQSMTSVKHQLPIACLQRSLYETCLDCQLHCWGMGIEVLLKKKYKAFLNNSWHATQKLSLCGQKTLLLKLQFLLKLVCFIHKVYIVFTSIQYMLNGSPMLNNEKVIQIEGIFELIRIWTHYHRRAGIRIHQSQTC